MDYKMLECRDRRLQKGIRDAEYRHCIPKRCRGEDRKSDYRQGPEKSHYTVCGPKRAVCNHHTEASSALSWVENDIRG
jgi:hypothetical protein